MTERYIERINKAVKSLQIADHLTYITFPLIKEKRLLLKILDEIHLSLLNLINAILQYEYVYKRIQLYHDTKSNFRTFIEKCAPRYEISKEQISKILDIFTLAERHKKSPMEFIKNNKVVIMSDNLKTNYVDVDKIKEYLLLTKEILKKTKEKIINKKV